MVDGWPFLLTKSRLLDYFTVLCPGFIIESKLLKPFRQVLDSLASAETAGVARHLIDDAKLRKLTFYYKCERARLNGEELADAQGRAIMRIFGVAVKGHRADLTVDEV